MEKGDIILKKTMTDAQSAVVNVATGMKKTEQLDGLATVTYSTITVSDLKAIENAINNLETSASGNCCQGNCCQSCQTSRCQSSRCQSCQSCQSQGCQSQCR